MICEDKIKQNLTYKRGNAIGTLTPFQSLAEKNNQLFL